MGGRPASINNEAMGVDSPPATGGLLSTMGGPLVGARRLADVAGMLGSEAPTCRSTQVHSCVFLFFPTLQLTTTTQRSPTVGLCHQSQRAPRRLTGGKDWSRKESQGKA